MQSLNMGRLWPTLTLEENKLSNLFLPVPMLLSNGRPRRVIRSLVLKTNPHPLNFHHCYIAYHFLFLKKDIKLKSRCPWTFQHTIFHGFTYVLGLSAAPMMYVPKTTRQGYRRWYFIPPTCFSLYFWDSSCWQENWWPQNSHIIFTLCL